jgi:hypothetical protein
MAAVAVQRITAAGAAAQMVGQVALADINGKDVARSVPRKDKADLPSPILSAACFCCQVAAAVVLTRMMVKARPVQTAVAQSTFVPDASRAMVTLCPPLVQQPRHAVMMAVAAAVPAVQLSLMLVPYVDPTPWMFAVVMAAK